MKHRNERSGSWTSARAGLFLAAFEALGALTGCGSAGTGDYYCDDKGCHTCDGTTCTDAPGPGTASLDAATNPLDDASATDSSAAQLGDGSATADGSTSTDSGAKAAECAIANDCESTQSCIGGFCRYECGTNEDCLLIDGRIPTCGPIAGSALPVCH